MQTKILTDVPGYEGQEIVIKKFTYGEKSDIAGKSVGVQLVHNVEKVEIELGKLKVNYLVYGIAKAPFFEGVKTNKEKENIIYNFENISAAEYLFKQIKEFNDINIPDGLKKK